jgi:cell division septation protein DedD
MSFSLMASAQASGGQIRRPVKRQSTSVSRKPVTTTKSQSNAEEEKPISPTDSSPNIEPVPISSLAMYNVVISTFSILGNAQRECQKLREAGWDAQIYLDSSNMYRVLMVGSSDEPEAILYRNHARQTYPNAWILCVRNGQAYRYQ